MKIFSISHGLTDTFTSISFACHQRFIFCGHRSWLQPPGPRQLRKQTCLRNTVSLWFPKAVACTRNQTPSVPVPAADLRLLLLDFFMRDLLWNTQWLHFLGNRPPGRRIVVESVGCTLLKRTESSGIVPTKSGVMKDSAEVKHESTVWLFSRCLHLLWCPDVTFSNSRAWPSPKVRRKSMTEIGWPSRSPTWKHRVLFEVQPWHSQSSKWTNVILSIDILWCPDRQRPSETITLDLLQSQSGIAAESYQRNQAQRKILQRSSMKAPCDFFEMFWPSLISWSALTLSGVRCNLHKQSRLTFFRSQSEIHDGIGRSSRSPVWKHRVSFSRFTLDRHRGQYSAYQLLPSNTDLSPMSWSALTLSEVTCDLLKQTLFDFLQSQSRIGRNQAERTNEIRRFAWQLACGFFEIPWPFTDVN